MEDKGEVKCIKFSLENKILAVQRTSKTVVRHLYSTKKRTLEVHLAGFPGGASGKESACNAGDTRDADSIPGLERSSGGGHGNPLQYSCLENPKDRRA